MGYAGARGRAEELEQLIASLERRLIEQVAELRGEIRQLERESNRNTRLMIELVRRSIGGQLEALRDTVSKEEAP